MELNSKEFFETTKPWIRLIIGLIYDLKYTTTVDDWSTKQSYMEADKHMVELEKSMRVTNLRCPN